MNVNLSVFSSQVDDVRYEYKTEKNIQKVVRSFHKGPHLLITSRNGLEMHLNTD